MRIDEKIEKFLNEYGEESEYHLRNKNPGSLVGTGLKRNPNPTIELLDDDGIGLSREKIRKAWPHKITYDGKSIFEPYLEVIKNLRATLQKQFGSMSSGQECYLGYNPNNESFYSGFDWFISERDSDQDERLSVVFTMGFDNGHFTRTSVPHVEYMGFYDHNGMHDRLHKDIPGMIDLRLD